MKESEHGTRVVEMKINLNTYCSCSHCGKKAGTYTSMGTYERILYPYESPDDFKLLCIECVHEELNAIQSTHANSEIATQAHTLLSSLWYMYSKVKR